MRTPATSQYKVTRFILGLLAAFLCAGPARAQFVSTATTNFNSPTGVAVDASDNVYIADTGNNRIAKYVPGTGVLTTLAGSGLPNSPGTTNGTGTGAGLDQPWGIVAGTVGGTNGLIVTDYGSSLIRFVTYGGAVSTLAGQPFDFGANNGPVAAATFSFPTGVAQDSLGNIYVADSPLGDIRIIATNNTVSTIAAGFGRPTGLAVDNSNNVWVADAGDEVICMISKGIVTVMAGISNQAGTNDSLTATSAQFYHPSGLLWVSASQSFLIADSGNDTVRSLFMTNGGWAVQTLAGLPGLPGLANGAPATAQFDNPIGLSVDPTDSGFYIVDNKNNALRVFQETAPIPPPDPPVLGYITLSTNGSTVTSEFNPTSFEIFNAPAIIGYTEDANSTTFITYSATGSSNVNGPSEPGAYSSSTQTAFTSIITTMPDVTVTAYSQGPSGARSTNVTAEYKFVTANPSIGGTDAADITLTDVTPGAAMYYTLDGTIPSPTNGAGPYYNGATLPALTLISNLDLLTVVAFAPNFAPSGLATEELSISNDVGNQLTWGFANGPASTHFITGLNLKFDAPVTFTGIASSLPIYTFQLDLTVTNNGAQPTPVYGFFSDLVETFAPPQYTNIPPGIFVNGGIHSGIIGTQPDTLELAWIVTTPVTNLYTSASLLNNSISSLVAEFFLPLALVGEFTFVVPAGATPGTPYTLQINYPSASSYSNPLDVVEEEPLPVFVEAPTNGPLTGTGPNSIKLLTVLSNNSPASAHLEGDVMPVNWYNIGDFGDGVLLDDDVIQTLNFVGKTGFANNPYFDAMDSSNGSTNNYYMASDAFVSTIGTGDGIIDVDDVYVTLRRSLDPGISNYSRIWTGTSWVPINYTNSVQQQVSAPRTLTVAADQVNTSGSLTAQVPIRILVPDLATNPLPVKVFMVNAVIEPLDGSPAIATAASFSAVTNLGSPYATVSQSVNNYTAAWLNSTVSGVSGTNLIGTLTVTLPPNVTTNSAYRVHFSHFSASPNGLALFKTTMQDGLITVGNRTGSSWHDGIPDTWRLLYFGTVSNILSAANADPDGDGANNWQEYVAGTNPLDAASVFEFAASAAPSGASFTLQWPSVVNKTYTLQSSSSPGGGWTNMVTNLPGNSQTLQWTDTNASAGARFYRALVQ